jgi:hypothetical protein
VDVYGPAVDPVRVSDTRPPRERLLRELPGALLAALAATQIALAYGAQLSPWKGGGFGMFATNDHGSFRGVRVFALRAGGEERIEVPPELRRAELRVRELPSERALRRLAEALAGEAPDAAALRAEVWRVEFDGELRPAWRKLAEATWTRPGNAPRAEAAQP